MTTTSYSVVSELDSSSTPKWRTKYFSYKPVPSDQKDNQLMRTPHPGENTVWLRSPERYLDTCNKQTPMESFASFSNLKGLIKNLLFHHRKKCLCQTPLWYFQFLEVIGHKISDQQNHFWKSIIVFFSHSRLLFWKLLHQSREVKAAFWVSFPPFFSPSYPQSLWKWTLTPFHHCLFRVRPRNIALFAEKN